MKYYHIKSNIIFIKLILSVYEVPAWYMFSLTSLLSKTEKAYLSGTGEFTKPQIRCIKSRLTKKLRLLEEEKVGLQSCNAASKNCNGPNSLQLQRLRSDNLIHETKDFIELRGSPSLVGRGIANPMSERTRGFEMLPSPL
jgi:hypothetical protein